MKKIFFSTDVDPYAQKPKLGALTSHQLDALNTCAALSPGFTFEVVSYQEYVGCKGSQATHVKVWREGNGKDCIALIGHDTVQVYDKKPDTVAVANRVSHRVYRGSTLTLTAPPTK